MNALRLVCEVIGALVLLGWAVVILGLLLAMATVHMERTGKRRELSLCRSCGEPQQGGYCQNCAPASGQRQAYPMIRAEQVHHLCRDPRCVRPEHLGRRIGRRAHSRTSSHMLEDLLDPTVDEP